MSAPYWENRREGDRVRVTLIGTVLPDPDWVSFDGAREGFDLSYLLRHTDGGAAVSMLPRPVYVNHDTTEYRTADVVRGVNDDPEVIHIRTRDGRWLGGDGCTYNDDELASAKGLILLVRDGKPVQP